MWPLFSHSKLTFPSLTSHSQGFATKHTSKGRVQGQLLRWKRTYTQVDLRGAKPCSFPLLSFFYSSVRGASLVFYQYVLHAICNEKDRALSGPIILSLVGDEPVGRIF